MKHVKDYKLFEFGENSTFEPEEIKDEYFLKQILDDEDKEYLNSTKKFNL